MTPHKPKREPLKVGQKIKFVGPVGSNLIGIYLGNDEHPIKAVVESFPGGPGIIHVRFEWNGDTHAGTIHRRQVTHVFKPRKREEEGKREERWLGIYPTGTDMFYSEQECDRNLGTGRKVHLVELYSTEAPVSRMSLMKAWLKVKHARGCISATDLVNEMGLPCGIFPEGTK